MKLFTAFKYVKGYEKYAVLNIIFNIFYALFSVISLTLVLPFLNLLGKSNQDLIEFSSKPEPTFSISKITSYVFQKFDYEVTQLIFFNGTDEASIKTGKLKALLFICFLVFFATFLKNLFRYLAMFFIAPIRIGVVNQLRNKLHEKTLQLPLSYFNDEKKGDLMSRITNDVIEIEFGIMTNLEILFREPLTIILLFISLISISAKLTLLVIVLLPLAALFIVFLNKSLKKSSLKSKTILGSLYALIEETLHGTKVIKAFSGELFLQKKFENVNKQFYNESLKLYRKTDLNSPLTETIVILILMVILYLGGTMVVNGTDGLTSETFIMYFIAASQLIPPIKQITVAYGFVQRGVASEERINKILLADNVIHESENPLTIQKFKNSVEYKNVSFKYIKGDEGYVLKNINLLVEKGKTIALVGQSGSGKTTLADMLPRFYDCDNGEILIDNLNIKNASLKSLRNQIGVVTQESILFNDTVFNNIVFGLQNVSLAQVTEAAKIANAHEFIEKLPNGYETNIGDRGSKLSGGQKQRLSIARAILRNPEILILDEATSALDTESEKLVQEALTNLMKNRTSIVIAHRLSTIANADEIIVMQQGEIIERGTHQQLYNQNGTYKRLCEMQSFK